MQAQVPSLLESPVMRAARALLVVCLLLGLGAVAGAGRGHIRDLRRSLEEGEEQATRHRLREQAGEVARLLRERLAAGDGEARYTRDGRLLRPAPPTEARAGAAGRPVCSAPRRRRRPAVRAAGARPLRPAPAGDAVWPAPRLPRGSAAGRGSGRGPRPPPPPAPGPGRPREGRGSHASTAILGGRGPGPATKMSRARAPISCKIEIEF